MICASSNRLFFMQTVYHKHVTALIIRTYCSSKSQLQSDAEFGEWLRNGSFLKADLTKIPTDRLLKLPYLGRTKYRLQISDVVGYRFRENYDKEISKRSFDSISTIDLFNFLKEWKPKSPQAQAMKSIVSVLRVSELSEEQIFELPRLLREHIDELPGQYWIDYWQKTVQCLKNLSNEVCNCNCFRHLRHNS